MKSQNVNTLSCAAARDFFMKEDSYVNFELPDYFHFDQLLVFCEAVARGRQLSDLCKLGTNNKPLRPSNYEGVNFTVLSNKDGAFSWRPLQIVHPVLYVELVNLITDPVNWQAIIDRFTEFSQGCVECISIPRESLGNESDKAAQIMNWWDKIEQESLRRALQFNYIFSTDIADCYGSIYTHSIEWALHPGGKAGVKAERAAGVKSRSLGGQIDGRLQNMNNGQTNGIPQGNVLSDFLAEIVLGYSDLELTKRLDGLKISRTKYHILRYRDDYRILANDPPLGHRILKELNMVLYELGLKMHPGKTKGSDDVILASLKPEKLEHIEIAPAGQTLQKDALRIYQLAKKYPNSGIILKELHRYYDRFNTKKPLKNVDPKVLISIFTMIPVHSPRSINICAAVLSKVMEYSETSDHVRLTKMIIDKYSDLPNVGLIEVWLQRISAPPPLKIRHSFVDPLTRVAERSISNIQLWESAWLDDEVVKLINAADISELPEYIINEVITSTINKKEVEMFKSHHYDW